MPVFVQVTVLLVPIFTTRLVGLKPQFDAVVHEPLVSHIVIGVPLFVVGVGFKVR